MSQLQSLNLKIWLSHSTAFFFICGIFFYCLDDSNFVFHIYLGFQFFYSIVLEYFFCFVEKKLNCMHYCYTVNTPKYLPTLSPTVRCLRIFAMPFIISLQSSSVQLLHCFLVQDAPEQRQHPPYTHSSNIFLTCQTHWKKPKSR